MKKLEDIPNEEGYRLVGYTAGGFPVELVVAKRRVTGLHYLENLKGLEIPIAFLIGWLPAEVVNRRRNYLTGDHLLEDLIAGIPVNSSNLETVAKTGVVSGALKDSIKRVALEYLARTLEAL